MEKKIAYYHKSQISGRYIANDEAGELVMVSGDLAMLFEYCEASGYVLKPKTKMDEMKAAASKRKSN